MSEPTAAERAQSVRLRLAPESLAAAREVLNTIDSLPWPEPERISALARLARAVRADVGKVLSGYALKRAPVDSFDQLLPIAGIGDKRFVGLVEALSRIDVADLFPEAVAIRQAWSRLADAQAEIERLRAELQRLRSASAETAEGATMRLDDLTSSVGSQLGAVESHLRTHQSVLRLGAIRLDLQGAAAPMGGDVGLDLSQPGGGSSVGLTFAPAAEVAVAGDAEVPDVVGYAPALARRKLEERGFVAQLAPYTGRAGRPGAVSRQVPAAGQAVAAGSLVRLLVRDFAS